MTTNKRIAALRRKGWAFLEAKEHAQAFDIFDQMIALDQSDATLVLEKGVGYFKVERYDEALSTFERVLEMVPGHLMALNNKAKALIHLERERDALDTYKRVLETHPDHAKTWLNCGLLMVRLEKADNALGCFEESRRLDPKNADAWYHKGVLLWGRGEIDAALAQFEQAQQLRKNFYELLRDRARIYRELGRRKDAAEEMAKALDAKPGAVEAKIELGQLMLELKRPTKASLLFTALIETERNCAEAWEGKGRALDQLGERARGALNRGTACMIRGEHEEALRLLDRATTIDPRYTQAWSNKGVVYGRMAQHEEALRSYQKALALSPHAVPVMHNIAMLLVDQLGRRDEGLRVFKKIIQIEPNRWFELPKAIRTAVDRLK